MKTAKEKNSETSNRRRIAILHRQDRASEVNRWIQADPEDTELTAR